MNASPSPDLTGSSKLFSSAAQSFGARAFTLPVIAIAGLLLTRLVVSNVGEAGYATYALIVGLVALVPFLDLGIGAAVTDAVSRRDSSPAGDVASVIHRSVRILGLLALGVIAVSWIFAGLGLWAPILGVPNSSDVEIASAIGFTLFGISIPLSLGARILQGAERNYIAVGLQTLMALTGLFVVAIAAWLNAPLWVYVSGPFLGAVVVAISTTLIASRVTGISLFSSSHVAPSPSVGPMVIISLAEPVAWQADRLILSHFSTVNAVATYSLVFALFAPLSSLVAASGNSLWPLFAKRRVADTLRVRDLLTTTAGFAGLGVLLAGALVAIGPFLTRFMSKGTINVPTSLFMAFGIVIIIVSAWAPSAMTLTYPKGLRFMAGLTMAQVVTNIPLSIVLASKYGAVGPVVASGIVIAVALAAGFAFAVREIRGKTMSTESATT